MAPISKLSINGQITLSLADDGFLKGRVGFYTESAKVKLTGVQIEELQRPIIEHEAVYTATRPMEMLTPEPGPAENL